MVNHRLKELRTKNRISGNIVAESVGISSQYYYELERGEKRLNEDLIRKLARFFEVSTDYLLKMDTEDGDGPVAAHHRGQKGEEIDEGLTEIIREFGEKYEAWRKKRQK